MPMRVPYSSTAPPGRGLVTVSVRRWLLCSRSVFSTARMVRELVDRAPPGYVPVACKAESSCSALLSSFEYQLGASVVNSKLIRFNHHLAARELDRVLAGGVSI